MHWRAIALGLGAPTWALRPRSDFDPPMPPNSIAANGAIKEKGVLSGVRVERSEIGQPGEFDHLSDDELERMVVEQFIQLFGPKLAISR